MHPCNRGETRGRLTIRQIDKQSVTQAGRQRKWAYLHANLPGRGWVERSRGYRERDTVPVVTSDNKGWQAGRDNMRHTAGRKAC